MKRGCRDLPNQLEKTRMMPDTDVESGGLG